MTIAAFFAVGFFSGFTLGTALQFAIMYVEEEKKAD